MRILFVNEKCGYMGGVEQNIAEAAAALGERGHQCFLLYGTETDRGSADYQRIFEQVFPCSELGAPGDATLHTPHPFVERKLGSARGQPPYSAEFVIQLIGPDVIYFHKVPTIGPFVNPCEKIHTVRMVHDHDLCCPRHHKYFALSGRICHHRAGWRCYGDLAFIERNRQSRIPVAYSSIRKKLAEMKRNSVLDTLLVGSRYMRDELVMNGFPEERVHILPPVVRQMETKPLPMQRQSRVLYVGQLIRGKGVDLLLQALAQVRQDYQATIVGAGNAENKLKTLCAELGLDKKVRFAGWVDHEELKQHYHQATVLAVPSRWPEPFGMIGLEAMHHSRPVVGFDVGGIPDWLEHDKTGLLVPEQDTAQLAAALETLLANPELAEKLGRGGFEQVVQKYAFTSYVDTLETLLSRNRSGSPKCSQ